MLRGTLRQQGYCKAWNVFVQLGLTDDSYTIEDSEHLTYAQLVDAFLPKNVDGKSLKAKVASFIHTSAESEKIKMVEWTGIFENKPIGLKNASPAQILQQLLEQKWKLNEGDKDMIVMVHQFVVRSSKSGDKKITSSLAVKGEDSIYTAMAKTVGLPVAIAAKNILNGEIKIRGVQLPVQKEIYEPLLKELETFGIKFREG
jgi:saccharopine dehydrogenase-like NADP-dependent oxidoreductase